MNTPRSVSPENGRPAATPAVGAWQGAGPDEAFPRLTISVAGALITPELLQRHAANHSGLGALRYSSSGSGCVDVLLLAEIDGGVCPVFLCVVRNVPADAGSAVAADFGICVGQSAVPHARRQFHVPDAETACAFLLAVVSQLQGRGAICIDLADLLHAWDPCVQHDIRWERWAYGQEGCESIDGDIASLFILAGRDSFEMALV